MNFTIRVTDGGTIRKVTVDSSDLERAIAGVRTEAGSASRALSSIGGQMKSYIGGLVAQYASVTAAVSALVGVTKQALSVNMDFEKKSSELAAVLGKSTGELAEMTQAAKDLGRTTQFTATQVEELQIALARLGFSEIEIGNMQESVLKFAAAVNTDLGSAADFAGSALRAFGLDSSKTTHLLDVMSASTSKSALDFSKLQTSISIVGPIAHSFGVSVEDTVTLLGTLSNAGFDASSAATALRNIFLNLSNENGKLAKGLGHTARTFPEIIASLKECTEKGISLSEALEMTDQRSVSAFSAMISGAGSAEELREALDNCDGSLEKMYKTMTDNMAGAVDSLKSAWEGLLLSMSDEDGALQNIIISLANIINLVTSLRDRIRELPDASRTAIQALSPFYLVTETIKKLGRLAGKANEHLDRQSGDGVNNQEEFIGPVFDPTKVQTSPIKKPSRKEIEKFNDALADYRKAVQSAVEANRTFNAGWNEQEVILNAMKSGITSLIGKYGTENEEVRKLIRSYYDLARARSGRDAPLPEVKSIVTEKASTSKQLEDRENARWRKAVGLQQTVPDGLAGFDSKDINQKKKEIKDLYSTAEQTAGVRDAISSIGDAFGSLGDIIGETAGQWAKWAGSLLQAIAQAIPAINVLILKHRQSTAASTGEAVAKGASAVADIPIVGPGMAVAAAATILATIMSTIAAIPKFAKGGIAYGPTLGLFGEYSGASSNPEVVAPVNTLATILGNMGFGGGRIDLRLRGRYLYGAMEREHNFRSRIG